MGWLSLHRASAVVAVGMIVGGSIGGTGCSPKTNFALDRARAAYQQAQADPELTAHASVALHDAETALRRTEQTWENSKDEAEVAHLAYLTERRIEIARVTAQQKITTEETKRLHRKRERIQIEARTREAEQARQTAEARTREAEQARQTAEARTREAEEARRVAEEALARAKQLEDELAGLKAQQTERGLVLTLGDVLFEVDRAELRASAVRGFSKLVTFLRDHPEREVLIEGHTDSTGSDSYNLDLSRRRAGAVQDFLVQNGVNSERLTVIGYGETYPVASNDTNDGRQQNRRVELVILREGERAAERMR